MDSELSQLTIRHYLSYLSGVFLTATAAAWSVNLSAKAAKTPKIYLTDSGLAAHVLMAGAAALRRPEHPALGGLTETFVFVSLVS